ncbi:MAG: hypothetical protein B7Z60_09675 [Ferrovum sp. 37-45-19]|jgi:hypothetical protein|nr:MAG: hypothetical protein B7Z60_09675 [Ferrovum sp. 37-45-19]OZB32689.1 MAG: hypothetical protein B7X47_05820 [Ferrovum sp. 34-44-207]HQU07226.1 hypothetical protein [Ferrovaceae bacterium]
MYRKKTRFQISLFVIMMLAWGQFVMAAHACSQQSPVTSTLVKVSAPMPADCIGMDSSPTTTGDQPSPLCLAHCEQSAQSHQTSSVPDLPSAALVTLFEVLQPTAGNGTPSGIFIHHPFLSLTEGSPPLRIQYQVFRI